MDIKNYHYLLSSLLVAPLTAKRTLMISSREAATEAQRGDAVISIIDMPRCWPPPTMSAYREWIFARRYVILAKYAFNAMRRHY